MQGWASIRTAVVVVTSAAVVIGLAPAASAAYASEPVGPSWVPNAGVHSVVVDEAANRVYVGGSFTGGVAALTADTGQLVWRGNANGDVRALALAPSGRLLIGGAFTTVDGFTHRRLAAVSRTTGAVDNTLKPSVGGTVRDIVVVGSIAYFGGSFTQHDGITQGRLGAFDLGTNRAVAAFTASANDTVYSLGTDGSRLFVGGKFTAVNGLTRNFLASVTLATNALDAWAPARACTDCNVIWDLTVDNPRNRVYTVGRNSGTLFTLNKTTAATIYRNVGTVNGDSQAVTLAPDGHVYVGGHFVTVNGVTRMLVAAFDVSGTRPVLGAFSTRFVTTYPGVWAMDSTGTRLYVGGDFTQAGASKRYPYFAMFGTPDAVAPTVTATDPTDGATVPVTTTVTVAFSEAVLGVDRTTFRLRQNGSTTDVPADVVYDAVTRTATLRPAADLAAGTPYTVTLTGGIRDAAGNPLPTTSRSFSTAAPPPDTTAPTLTGIAPPDGASAVDVATTVTATFSEPVQGVGTATFTLTAADGTPVPATVAPGATADQWVLTPTALAPSTAYTAALTGGITDAEGNALTPTSWTFTTGVPVDSTPPRWTGRVPSLDGATGISRTANVAITFSEPVTNVTTTTFTLTPASGGPPVPATVSFNTTNGRWVLNPNSTLDASTRYTANVTSDVTDLALNAFPGVTWSFTTGA